MALAGFPLHDLRHVFVTHHLSLAKTPSALKLNQIPGLLYLEVWLPRKDSNLRPGG